ncbi:MAG TPA: glutamine amidotransferase [Pirellulaceae bacterium]|nr:glutamine amidotransferase [Pirellulaceae bacterium]
MSDWTLEPVAPVWIIVLVTGLGLGLLAVRSTHRPLALGPTRTLGAIRIGLILMMAVAMLRPGCVRTVQRPQRVTVAVAMDVSRSMELPHEAGGVSRREKLAEAIRENAELWRRISERFELKAFVYDGELREASVVDGVPALPESSDGAQTDHGQTLDRLAEQLRGDRVAALLLMGDGVQNADFPRVELPRALREIEQLQAPLFAVPFGRTGADEAFVDVAVTNLPDQYAVFVKNSLTVRATVRARGFVNRTLPVRLIRIDASGAEEIVGTAEVTPTKPDDELPVELNYAPQEPGEYRLVVRADVQPREVVERNNELTAFLTVHDGGLKVLYLEGRLDLEQRYLRRSLAASQDLQVDFLWIDHRDRSRWPLDLTSALSDPSYDVVILGDLDSRALHREGATDGNLKVLADRVEKGMGLVTLGGRHALGPGRYQRTPLADVLPIRINEFEAQDFDAPLNGALHLDRELSLRVRESHFLTRLGGDDDEQAWRSLPDLLGANRIAGLKSSSRVLLETDREEPILVVGSAGGRVAVFAGDTTWRWWTFGRSETHRRFWRQMVLWAAGLDSLGRDAIVVDLDRRRFVQGSPVTAEIGARTAAGDPLPDATLQARLIGPDGTSDLTVPSVGALRAIEVSPELLTAPGDYALEVSAAFDGNDLGSRRVEFVLFDDDREKGVAAADPEQLARIAAATREAGGDLVAPERLRDRLEQIAESPIETEIEIPQRWRLGDTTADAALFVLSFVGLWATEWGLRRRWGRG